MEQILSWATKSSLWYFPIQTGCCADEVLNTLGCRYDLERFGLLPLSRPEQADLLIVQGVVTRKLAPYIKGVYDSMLHPKFVLAIGACACTGGAFAPESSYEGVGSLSQIIPVDIYVPGCPPRPEAIMNGIINLQKKIAGGAYGCEQRILQD